MAVNSSHLSPGLSFNCSALPAGSSLLWSSATLFFTAFHEYHFAPRLLWGFLAPGITFDHLPLCKSASVLGASRTQYLSHAGLSSLQQIWNPKHFLKCFSPPPPSVYLLKSSAAAFGVLAARGQGANIQSASELGGTKNPPVCVSLGERDACFSFMSAPCVSLMRWSSALFCCHLAKGRKVYRCVFHCETCVRDEREKEAGHSLHRGSVLHSHLHRYSDNWTGLKEKKILLFVLSRRQTRNEMSLIIQNIFLRVEQGEN